MAETLVRAAPPPRPEYVLDLADASGETRIKLPLRPWQRLASNTGARRILLLVLLALLWEIYARAVDNPLVLPTFGDTIAALWDGLVKGPLLLRAVTSLKLLGEGYAIGIVLALLLTLVAVANRICTDLLALLTAGFNPLPAIALLPLALLWFGIGEKSLIFVLVHAVLWPMALNTYSGFLGVSPTLRMVGQSFGLKGLRYSLKILIPAAFPSLLTGLKVSWAFAWRTLIAAELVFGVNSGSGGLGWFIYQNRNLLLIADVFAGLLTVTIIGLVMETVIFRAIERATVLRWGMQR